MRGRYASTWMLVAASQTKKLALWSPSRGPARGWTASMAMPVPNSTIVDTTTTGATSARSTICGGPLATYSGRPA